MEEHEKNEGDDAAIALMVDHLKRLAQQVSCSSPSQEKRLLDLPIDILCFGRSGVGKTSLLEAITGKDLGSTPRLNHGTTTLRSIDVSQQVRLTNGEQGTVNIRLWDTVGIDTWSPEKLSVMFSELAEQKAHPICVFYCATAHGRVDSEVVTKILTHFRELSVVVFYVVTNMFAMSDTEFDTQMEEGKNLMMKVAAVDHFRQLRADTFEFEHNCFLLAVNSKVCLFRSRDSPQLPLSASSLSSPS